MRIKRDPLDVLFSDVVRARDRHCVWCGKQGVRLECSHIYGRRHKGTRWSELNAKALCFTCHRRWHEDPAGGMYWITHRLGQPYMDRLALMAHGVTKLTEFDKHVIKNELRERLEIYQTTHLGRVPHPDSPFAAGVFKRGQYS